jgi:hypothetical protein
MGLVEIEREGYALQESSLNQDGSMIFSLGSPCTEHGYPGWTNRQSTKW